MSHIEGIQVPSHESRVTSHESRVTSHESRVTSHESRVTTTHFFDGELDTVDAVGTLDEVGR